MNKKHWYKIETYEEKGNYHHLGSSKLTLEEITKQAEQGKYIKLDDLLYRKDDQIKNWSEWDKSLKPMRYFNPEYIVTIMEFKQDPRNTPKSPITKIK